MAHWHTVEQHLKLLYCQNAIVENNNFSWQWTGELGELGEHYMLGLFVRSIGRSVVIIIVENMLCDWMRWINFHVLLFALRAVSRVPSEPFPLSMEKHLKFMYSSFESRTIRIAEGDQQFYHCWRMAVSCFHRRKSHIVWAKVNLAIDSQYTHRRMLT